MIAIHLTASLFRAKTRRLAASKSCSHFTNSRHCSVRLPRPFRARGLNRSRGRVPRQATEIRTSTRSTFFAKLRQIPSGRLICRKSNGARSDRSLRPPQTPARSAQIPIAPAARHAFPSAVSSLGDFRTPAAGVRRIVRERPASKPFTKSAFTCIAARRPPHPHEQTFSTSGLVGIIDFELFDIFTPVLL